MCDSVICRAKAELLYAYIDGSGFYKNPVAKNARSWMNVPFTLPREALDAAFLKESEAAGLLALKGHRAVPGSDPHRGYARKRAARRLFHSGGLARCLDLCR